jgi:hypothetical protein
MEAALFHADSGTDGHNEIPGRLLTQLLRRQWKPGHVLMQHVMFQTYHVTQ